MLKTYKCTPLLCVTFKFDSFELSCQTKTFNIKKPATATISKKTGDLWYKRVSWWWKKIASMPGPSRGSQCTAHILLSSKGLNCFFHVVYISQLAVKKHAWYCLGNLCLPKPAKSKRRWIIYARHVKWLKEKPRKILCFLLSLSEFFLFFLWKYFGWMIKAGIMYSSKYSTATVL